MRAWVALLKRDFKLTRTVFFVGLVINVLIAMLTIYLGMKAENTLLMFIPVVAAVVFHVFYVPIIVFISLKTEANQLHLWLHNPQSASTLLISKIVDGLIMIVISLLMLYVMSGLLMIIPKFSLIEADWTDTWISGLLIFPHIILISIMTGVLVMFFWALYQFLKFKIGRWSLLVVIGTVILSGWIVALFESTKLYILLTQWGSMGINFNFSTFSLDPIQVYTGEYFYNFIIIIGLFFLSAWIIDNKVEV
ncbi:hypothetical protein [Paenibacillus prosopidis]|uniref:Uncharacterized protein n=1 Tax=Paenibacillus prosopidis TaxID=630520 RepID=A0A368W1L8_9BACL|nr:hypothetical protein [Paenibacillus prosopidis]RCW48379.1 hypothetical protein DFP97_10679 [Paenibacillus prosopidis]